MAAIVLGPRYEIKLRFPAPLRPWLQSWIRSSPAHWRVAYPPRWVNSLYFDDASASALRANLEGWGEREKVRLRWYGPTLHQLEEAGLEIKARRGSIGTKQLYFLQEFHGDLSQLSWEALLRHLRRFPFARRWLLRYPRPALIVRYRRAYYVSARSRIRLTVDERITAFEQGLAPRPNLRRAHPRTSDFIVELKAPPSLAGEIAACLNELPIRPTRHSKYVVGRLPFARGGYVDA